METKYNTLKRPRRKLCYLTNKKSPSKQWADKLSLEDIDGMFDDLDSCSPDNDISPLQATDESNQSEISPVQQKGHLIVKRPVCQSGSGRDILNSAKRSLAPELENVETLNIPFKLLQPVKTSSPIEETIVVEDVAEEDAERALVVPQVLDFEEPKTDLETIQIPHCNAHVTEEEFDSELESPPSRVILSKPTMSSLKKQAVTSCKESLPTQEKTPKKPQKLAERKTPRQENTDPSGSAVSQEPDHTSPMKSIRSDRQPSAAERSTRGGNGINAFLEKVRNAERTKPACFRGLQSLVKVPTPPPEPEDDFLILEDDTPLIYIPSKSSTRKTQRQKETKAEPMSADRDCSVDKGTTNGKIETAQNEEALVKENPKKESQPVNQKMKKNKRKENRNELTGPGYDKCPFSIAEDLSPGDSVEQERPNKKKQRDRKALKQRINRHRRQTDEEANSVNNTLKSSDVNSLKSSKEAKEKVKKKQKTELKDLGSLSDKEIGGSGAQTGKSLADGKAKQNTLPAVSAGSSSEESDAFVKRKRKQPGQWWLSCPENTEDTKITASQPTTKKTKPNKKESRTGLPSPVKAKKDRDLKKRNQKPSAPAPSEHTTTAVEKKTKGIVKRITRVESPAKRKSTDIEQIDAQHEQLDVPGQDQDREDFSPLVFAQRELSLSSGTKVFQRVSNENMSSTPASVSTRRPEQQQPWDGETDKRRRKPPGNWWLVSGLSEDVEHGSPQLQKLHREEHKPHKERKNLFKEAPRLGTPKNTNMAVSLKLQRGTATPALKLKPLSAPKTVKRSLATFKDIFTSAAETEMGNKDMFQNNTHSVPVHSAEEVSVFSQNSNIPQDSKCQSENMSKELKSGPSSMIQLEQYEDNDDFILPSSRAHAPLLMSDLCAPPLKPLILQPKDKANLAEWFRSLWSSVAPNAAEVSPNEFEWYFYQDRALGFLLDVNCGSACVGRLLLGSYTKKPLWVDHSASTVFNLLTSSVIVVIDSKESRFHAGQCFTVQCGHAYSIQNLTAQPAVMYFTRILAEGSD